VALLGRPPPPSPGGLPFAFSWRGCGEGTHAIDENDKDVVPVRDACAGGPGGAVAAKPSAALVAADAGLAAAALVREDRMHPDGMLRTALRRTGLQPAEAYSSGDVARVIGRHPRTVRRMVVRGELKAVGPVRRGVPVRISHGSLYFYLREEH